MIRSDGSGGNDLQRFRASAGHRYHLYPGMVLEEHAQTFTHDQLVVHYHDAYLYFLRCWLHAYSAGP